MDCISESLILNGIYDKYCKRALYAHVHMLQKYLYILFLTDQ